MSPMPGRISAGRRRDAGLCIAGPTGRDSPRLKFLSGSGRWLPPPAWKNVWICPYADGHIQATGRDAKGRKQYRYHARFREIRESTKYEPVVAFAEALH